MCKISSDNSFAKSFFLTDHHHLYKLSDLCMKNKTELSDQIVYETSKL